jgi:uncharacterized protein YcfL
MYKLILFTILSASLVGCSSTPKSEFESKDEQIAWLQYQVQEQKRIQAEEIQKTHQAYQTSAPEIPASNLFTPRVCVQEPIYDLYGRYVRTTTNCR